MRRFDSDPRLQIFLRLQRVDYAHAGRTAAGGCTKKRPLMQYETSDLRRRPVRSIELVQNFDRAIAAGGGSELEDLPASV